MSLSNYKARVHLNDKENVGIALNTWVRVKRVDELIEIGGTEQKGRLVMIEVRMDSKPGGGEI